MYSLLCSTYMYTLLCTLGNILERGEAYFDSHSLFCASNFATSLSVAMSFEARGEPAKEKARANFNCRCRNCSLKRLILLDFVCRETNCWQARSTVRMTRVTLMIVVIVVASLRGRCRRTAGATLCPSCAFQVVICAVLNAAFLAILLLDRRPAFSPLEVARS